MKLGIKPVFPKRMSLGPRVASGLKCICTRSHPTDPVVLSIAHGEQIEICAPSRHCILLWFGSAIYVRMKILSSGWLRPARRLKCDNRTRLFFGIAAFLPVISRAAAVILRILVSLIAP